MTPERFKEITRRYGRLRLAVVGDFCLDRYLEIDPAKAEVSIETGLKVHNVVRVRSQPGGAGTILNNLAALGVGRIYPVGFAGDDGEGVELERALQERAGVDTRGFLHTPLRRTFTYCKPLIIQPGRPPVELNRLDSKNWTPTPAAVQEKIVQAMGRAWTQAHGMILLDQVDRPGTGVVTPGVLQRIRAFSRNGAGKVILADCRRGLRGYPPVCFKMNQAELLAMSGAKKKSASIEQIGRAALKAARANGRPVFVTLAERGMIGADPAGRVAHVEAWPLRGPIDVVGAGDAVTANLATALAAGAGVAESVILANAAASLVVHQLGTTGTASVKELGRLLFARGNGPRLTEATLS